MKNKKGFTLVELLAVIAILALLITISVPRINTYIIDKKKDNFLSSARNICRQLEYDNLDYKNFTSKPLGEFDLTNLPSTKYDLEKSIAYVNNNEIYINLVGKGEFEGFYACHVQYSSNNIEVQKEECGPHPENDTGGQDNPGSSVVTYKLRLNGNGITVLPSEITVTYDGEYTGLPTATRAGYTFIGWFIGNTEIKNGDKVTITSNAEAKALWEANTYTINYELDGGTLTTNKPTTGTYGSVLRIDNPEKARYTFVGWTVTSGLNTNTAKHGISNGTVTSSITSSSTKIMSIYFKNLTSTNNGSVTLTANYILGEYILILNGNGVSVTPSEINVQIGGTYSGLPTLTREGYTFKGWYIGETKIENGDTVTITSNAEARAKWEANTYLVTFNANGGSLSTEEFTTVGEEEYIAPGTGTYKLEVWGAQGGGANGGYGGYSTGEIELEKNEVLYVNVGANPTDASSAYNGGAKGGSSSGYGGGGATHIAMNSGELVDFAEDIDSKINDILIVAGGGGGADNWSSGAPGGSGGGYNGQAGSWTGSTSMTWSLGGTQASGGICQTSGATYSSGSGSFGIGGNGATWGGGGGGGFYGGSGGNAASNWVAAGGGGSGYIGNPLLSNKAMYCYNCESSSEESTKTITVSDTTTALEPNLAKVGDGAAKISNLVTIRDIKYDINLNSMPVPTREGYTFTGWYTEKDGGEKITNYNISDNQELYAQWLKTEFAYMGDYQEFVVPEDGYYKIELWGSQVWDDPNYNESRSDGAYVSGEVYFSKNEKLYIFVGQKSEYCRPYTECDGIAYNGGGSGGYFTGSAYPARVSGGGGATDIRCFYDTSTGKCVENTTNLNWNDSYGLNSRIMVAAGAGGSITTFASIPAGGLIGYIGNCSNNGGAGTQFSGGSATSNATSGGFGYGGNGYVSSPTAINCNDGLGAGGGYYGGGGGKGGVAGCSPDYRGCGGSGSSFISGHTGSVAIKSSTDTTPRLDSNNISCSSTSSSGYNSEGYNTDSTCSIHYSNKVFTNTKMIDGSGYNWIITNGTLNKTLESMPNPNGGYYDSGEGHSGNGYARITYIGEN